MTYVYMGVFAVQYSHKAVMVFLYFPVVRELAELHKANASRASEAEEAALSREIQAKEKLSLALEKAQEEARMQQEALANQVMQANVIIDNFTIPNEL